ncbi:hypothetical protein [Rhodoferax antarcticus]|uniref:hypothetical protein n=1 Tax=Rhodoferax antarcticus TaxID=81479 RepID=UPI002225847E|nr:hypothetical protein [Rhodoferax antarcticus]MCW2313667.1 hypothetical protein [Rhodoferax antarcticus]
MSTRQIFNWNPEKNLLLIRERGISFERVVVEISSGNVSIHAPYGANLEEVTPLPNEFYPPEGGGFKPGSVFDKLAVLDHPNQAKYPGQKISMVQVDDYVYAVPFIETESEIFLKTIIPSRKATKQYRRKP